MSDQTPEVIPGQMTVNEVIVTDEVTPEVEPEEVEEEETDTDEEEGEDEEAVPGESPRETARRLIMGGYSPVTGQKRRGSLTQLANVHRVLRKRLVQRGRHFTVREREDIENYLNDLNDTTLMLFRGGTDPKPFEFRDTIFDQDEW